MDATILAETSDAAVGLWQLLASRFDATPWRFWAGGQWRDYWLRLVFDDRYVVCYFLPCVPILLLLSGRRLRIAIVLSGLAFLSYVFGAGYPLFWLGMCLGFYWLGQCFARQARRRDVVRWGPPLAAGACIAGWYLLTQALEHLKLPAGVNEYLFVHARWLFPLGARALAWEPRFVEMYPYPDAPDPAQLVPAIFWNPHNIGTAYFTVRMMQYFSELKRDTIPPQRRTLLNFLAFTCYAPTLMQGPLERYAEFQHQLDTCHRRRCWRNLPPALARIGWGILKSYLVVQYFGWFLWVQVGIRPHGPYYEHPEQIQSYALLYGGVFLQIWCLYLEFSGYCDVAAGIARLLGYQQIENFNRPWAATSMRDFWRRWHISLSFILRDYVYIPLGGNRRHRAFNVCFTFFLIGIWHRVTLQLALWGLVMGLMVVANQRWVACLKRLDARPHSRLAGLRRRLRRTRPLPQILSWALTMNAFVFSLLIFFGGSGALRVARELIGRPLGALSPAG